MSRYFAIQSWVSSHDNEPDYSGQQTGSRHVRSVEIPMYTQHGKANVDWFSDEQIALRSAANKPKSSIKDKILPQFRRLQTLQSQMVELENSYRAGEMDIKEYSLLRNVISVKKARAEVLYRKAISVRPTPHEDDEYADEMSEDSVETAYTINDHHSTDTPIAGSSYPSWIDDLSNENSLKNFLKIACKVVRKAVQLSQAARNYIKTLSEV